MRRAPTKSSTRGECFIAAETLNVFLTKCASAPCARQIRWTYVGDACRPFAMLRTLQWVAVAVFACRRHVQHLLDFSGSSRLDGAMVGSRHQAAPGPAFHKARAPSGGRSAGCLANRRGNRLRPSVHSSASKTRSVPLKPHSAAVFGTTSTLQSSRSSRGERNSASIFLIRRRLRRFARRFVNRCQ